MSMSGIVVRILPALRLFEEDLPAPCGVPSRGAGFLQAQLARVVVLFCRRFIARSTPPRTGKAATAPAEPSAQVGRRPSWRAAMHRLDALADVEHDVEAVEHDGATADWS